MNYNNCYCSRDYNNMAMFASALNEALVERYLIFRKQKTVLFWVHIDEIEVHIPKHHRDNYKQKLIEFKLRCIELVDQGYENGYFTEELIEKWRKEISEYLMNKNVVWE